MKRNLITIITAVVLVVIFALLLFTFQVRQSEVAVVTTFGKTTGAYQPGLHFRWPWPVQQVYKFDERIQNFEDKFSENLTADNINLITSVYVGWRISDAPQFLNSFRDGSIPAAESQLQSMLTSAKSAAVGRHPLSDFVNADPKQLKFDQIQNEIEQAVQDELQTNNYGIQLEFLGIKKLGLPESVTEAVFARMKSERNILISQAQNEGQAEAIKIKANAEFFSNGLIGSGLKTTKIPAVWGCAEKIKRAPEFSRIQSARAALPQNCSTGM
jgi:membrane protease subunit HflC